MWNSKVDDILHFETCFDVGVKRTSDANLSYSSPLLNRVTIITDLVKPQKYQIVFLKNVENIYLNLPRRFFRQMKSKQKQKTREFREFSNSGKMREKDSNRTTLWVYDYLVKNGYQNVAEEFAHVIIKKLRKESKQSVSVDPDQIAFTLVIDYLNKHDYQAVAKELQNEVKYEKVDLLGLDLQTILKDKLSKSEPKLSKLSNPEHDPSIWIHDYSVKNGYQNVAEELVLALSDKPEKDSRRERQSNCDKNETKVSKSRQVPEKESESKKRKLESCERTQPKVFKLPDSDQSNEDLNEKVTINDLFVDKLDDLKTLPQDSEIPRVVKFILDLNMQVRKSVRNTIHMTNSLLCGRTFTYIRTGKLSGLRYGDTSEESLVLKHFDILAEKVPICVPEKFLIQIEETTLTWCKLLLGAYLSQDLTENHRCASQLFKALICLKKRKGTWTPEEDELILALDAKGGSATDWNKLAMDLGRVQIALSTRLHYLKHYKAVNAARSRFTLEEDQKILEYVNERFDISSPESLKSVKITDLKNATNVIPRGQRMIFDHWNRRLLPTVLSYLYGAPEIQWKEEFLKYVVEQKVMSLPSMNWTDVLQKWPHQTKHTLSHLLDLASRSKSTSKCPLYQQVSAYLSHPIKRPVNRVLQDERRTILKIFDEIRFGKQ